MGTVATDILHTHHAGLHHPCPCGFCLCRPPASCCPRCCPPRCPRRCPPCGARCPRCGSRCPPRGPRRCRPRPRRALPLHLHLRRGRRLLQGQLPAVRVQRWHWCRDWILLRQPSRRQDPDRHLQRQRPDWQRCHCRVHRRSCLPPCPCWWLRCRCPCGCSRCPRCPRCPRRPRCPRCCPRHPRHCCPRLSP